MLVKLTSVVTHVLSAHMAGRLFHRSCWSLLGTGIHSLCRQSSQHFFFPVIWVEILDSLPVCDLRHILRAKGLLPLLKPLHLLSFYPALGKACPGAFHAWPGFTAWEPACCASLLDSTASHSRAWRSIPPRPAKAACLLDSEAAASFSPSLPCCPLSGS